ncbi:MAG: sporulation integral membrane protein YtvI, partial [Clostridia bacterium]|nr:sporulation integral membrane protein YtvI [Clostridia bacterium]
MGIFDMPERGWQRVLYLLLLGILLFFGTYLFFRWLWKPVLPFLLAALLAMALQKPLDRLDRLTRRRGRMRGIWAVFLVLVSAGGLIALLCMLGNSLITEGRSFFAYLGDNIGVISQRLDGMLWDFQGFVTSLPGFENGDGEGILFHALESADDLLIGMLGDAASKMTAKLPSLFGTFIAAFPQIFLFLAVWLIAAVYLTADWQKIGVWLVKRFPNRMSRLLDSLKSSLAATLLLYGRAYAIIILITFAELYLGFILLGISYALGAAAIIAVIDLLPVLGTGTVLLPWAVFALLDGDGVRAAGLLLLWVIISVVRQIIEPRIVGRHIGIHPLLALFSMYLGAKLFGISGLFLCPMAAAVAVRYYENRQAEGGMAV